MFYLPALVPHALTPIGEPTPTRNAALAAPRAVLLPTTDDAVERWLSLVKLYTKARGAEMGWLKMPKPKTTNADALRLSAMWSRELVTAARTGHNVKDAITHWKRCLAKVATSARFGAPTALYRDNHDLWMGCMRRLAVLLKASNLTLTPWRFALNGPAETPQLPTTTLADVHRSSAARPGDPVSRPAKLALVVLGGALLAPPIIRAVRT